MTVKLGQRAGQAIIEHVMYKVKKVMYSC